MKEVFLSVAGYGALKKAVVKSMSGKYIVYAIQMLTMVILSRHFSPADFGVLALLNVFYIFFNLLGEMGLGPAIVNEDSLSKEDRNGIFSFTLILATILGSLFYLLSPFLIGDLIDTYGPLGISVGVAIFFFVSSIVPYSALVKSQYFGKIAWAEASAEIVSLLFVLVYISLSDGVWALFLKPVISSISKFVFLYIFSSTTEIGRPIIGKKLSVMKRLYGFSGYQLGFSFLNYMSRNLDNLLVGKFLGLGVLGVYDKSYQLMRYPLMLLTFSMAPAIQPSLRKFKDDPEQLAIIHNRFLKLLSYIGGLGGILCYLLAEHIVLILLGDQWTGVIPVFEVLSIIIPLQVVMSTHGGFYQASGRVDLLFFCGGFAFLSNSLAIMIGVFYGADLVFLSWCLVCSFFVNFLQCYYVMCRKVLKISFIYFIGKVWAVFGSAIVMIFLEMNGWNSI
jgi:O-antigen/teichoic acid export membrane protein